MKSCYFDYNATTPVIPEVREAMEPFWAEHYANPSSLHHMGRAPYKAIRDARREVARLIGANDEDEIVFTSGGSESNTTAIRASLKLHPNKKEIVTTTVEHSSILKLFKYLEVHEGYKLHLLGVDSAGQLNLEELENVLTEDTAVVSVMTANNETGILFPIAEIARRVKSKNILMHVDAVQTIGKIPFSLQENPVDFLSISAHKFYGPKGIGALYIRSGIKPEPLIFGGNQEQGRRSGTENVPAIVGFGAASKTAREYLPKEYNRLVQLRDHFEIQVSRLIPKITIHGREVDRLPNTSHIRFQGVEAEALLMALDRLGICVSRGSACMSGAEERSYVLKAMKLSDAEADSAMRFSFGRFTTEEDIVYLLQALQEVIDRLRPLQETAQKSRVGIL